MGRPLRLLVLAYEPLSMIPSLHAPSSIPFRYTYFMNRNAFKGLLVGLVSTTLALLCARVGFAQESELDPSQPKTMTVDQIVQKFAAREKEFKDARDKYTWRQDIKVQTLDGETVTGEYREVFDVLFDNQNRRIENVVFAPQSSLDKGGLSLDEGDMKDFRNRLPFVLTSDETGEYNILYVGQQQEDDLHCYVLDVAPKQFVGKKRYFQGRLWVDDQDFQIVKTYGKGVPEIVDKKKKGKEEHLYPKFTTWRQQIDGKYWFPSYTRADDTLKFALQEVHIREIVKYSDYKRFGTSVKILYEGKELPQGEKKPDDNKKPEDQKKPDAPQK